MMIVERYVIAYTVSQTLIAISDPEDRGLIPGDLDIVKISPVFNNFYIHQYPTCVGSGIMPIKSMF